MSAVIERQRTLLEELADTIRTSDSKIVGVTEGLVRQLMSGPLPSRNQEVKVGETEHESIYIGNYDGMFYAQAYQRNL